MNADVCFRIGSTHKVCQDYGFCNIKSDPCIIISDGCSSADETDFGSRLLVRSAAAHAYRYNSFCVEDAELMLEFILKTAYTYACSLGLPTDALAATLLLAKIESNKIRVFCVGDGVIAGIRKTGEIDAFEFEFKEGAPYYLRYELSPESKTNYFKTFTQGCVERVYEINSEIKVEEKVSDFSPERFWFEKEFSLDDYHSVAILSDGASSFIRRDAANRNLGSSLPTAEVLKNVLAFKGFQGEFVQRRVQRVLKEFKDQNIQNYDDFSLGVLTINEQ